MTGLSEASSPLWTFTPLTATTVSVAPSETATIAYRITNQSPKTHTLTMRPINGVRQINEGNINITADGGLATQVYAATLGYGCLYEGEYIFL